MKSIRLLCTIMVAVLMQVHTDLSAQEEESGSGFNTGADLVSNYIWRGTKYGAGPAIQPSVSFTAGNFEIGVWGSCNVTSFEAAESDLYLSYSFPFGLSLALTDYYYPGLMYFDYSDTTGSHAFEIKGGFSAGGFSFSANYILNEAGGDMYFEAGYYFCSFNIFAGAGDGWNTSDGEFGLCNIGISTNKDIHFTKDFSIPVRGSVILNPEREQFYIVFGLSL